MYTNCQQTAQTQKDLNDYLLECLSQNNPQHADLQTRHLEMNLFSNLKAAETMLEAKLYSHYDRVYIAGILEQKGLIKLAIENYISMTDVKRCLALVKESDEVWITSYFKNLDNDNLATCLSCMVSKQSVKLCLKLLLKFHDKLGPENVINIMKN